MALVPFRRAFLPGFATAYHAFRSKGGVDSGRTDNGEGTDSAYPAHGCMDAAGLGTATKILHTHPFLSGKRGKTQGRMYRKSWKILTMSGIASRTEKPAISTILTCVIYIFLKSILSKYESLPCIIPWFLPETSQKRTEKGLFSQKNIGLLYAKVRRFFLESTEVCIKEVRCFCFPKGCHVTEGWPRK